MADGGALSPITVATEVEVPVRVRPALLEVQRGDTPERVNLSFKVSANSPEAEAFRQALGGDPEFVDYATGQLLNIFFSGKSPETDVNGKGINALIALLTAVDPQDPLEAAIGMQMAVMHHASLDAVRRSLHQSATADHQALNISQANKCSRTFVMLLDALNRHRGKVSTQRVIVENVTVEAGGQAVVGAVAGVGGSKNGAVQAHGQRQEPNDARGARRSALSCAESPRQPVSAPSEQGQEALPHARRRTRQRSAEGQPQSPGARSLQRRGGRNASSDCCTQEASAPHGAHGDGSVGARA